MKRVLVCPLNWGIGHAARCVRIVKLLQENGCEVRIAADDGPLAFLRKEFPGIEMIILPGTPVTYPVNRNFVRHFLFLIPRLLMGIRREHKALERIVREHRIDLVISDNRYGCWHPEVCSIFITHQLSIQLPARVRFLSGLLRRLNYDFIRRFDECWIPDVESHPGLAGKLSHPRRIPENTHYIGPLSRFEYDELPDVSGDLPLYDLVVLLSGPEPQRSVLEEIMLDQLLKTSFRAIVVRGLPESYGIKVLDDRIQVCDHLGTEHLQRVIRQSFLVVCRSGYSSIMDLVTLGKRAVFIPTPGQTEQEYLAVYLMHRKIFFSQSQKDFDLLYAIEMVKNYPGMVIRNDHSLLKERITSIAPATMKGKLSS